MSGLGDLHARLSAFTETDAPFLDVRVNDHGAHIIGYDDQPFETHDEERGDYTVYTGQIVFSVSADDLAGAVHEANTRMTTLEKARPPK